MRRLLETVLVVDDDDGTRRLLRSVLEQEGFRVLTAAHGAEALRIVRAERPDLVVLDLVLPWLNGVEVLSTIRDVFNLPKMPVVVVTGTGTSEFDLRAFRPIRLLKKPLDMDVLVQVVRQLLTESSRLQYE